MEKGQPYFFVSSLDQSMADLRVFNSASLAVSGKIISLLGSHPFRGSIKKTISLDSSYWFKTCFFRSRVGSMWNWDRYFFLHKASISSLTMKILFTVTNDPEDPRCVRLVLNGSWTKVLFIHFFENSNRLLLQALNLILCENFQVPVGSEEWVLARKNLFKHHPEMKDWESMGTHDWFLAK